MISAASKFTLLPVLLLVTACAVTLCPASLAQKDGANNAISPAEVSQTINQVRVAANENVVERALAIGGGLLRTGRFAEAADLFTALAERKPRDPAILYGQALATFNTGRVAEAERLARQAVNEALSDENQAKGTNRAQGSADALVLLAVILAVRGDDAAALKAVQQAVQLAPQHFDAQLALGRALFGIGDDGGAIRAFRAARALQPANAQALFFLATALERSGEIKAALATYRELIAIKPDMFEGHLGLGALLLKRGGTEAEEGLKELKRALEINSNLYEAHVALGRALIARGRAADAITHLHRAAELAPENPEPHYQLSLAYRRLGKNEEAAAQSAIVKRIHESRRGTKAVVQSRPGLN